jgi:glycosyltransferase involved in cell wall biosynthesis
MIIFVAFITILYLTLIGSFIYGFDKIKVFHSNNISPKTKFTVVIPFRNEARNLPALLQSIKSLQYPENLFEVILINDDSVDNSAEIIKSFIGHTNQSVKIISNERQTASPKKDAIALAIRHAKNDWIITTDADCILPEYWLNSYETHIQNSKAYCIAAPVTYNIENTFLNNFQILDLLSLQGATIGGFGIRKPFLCNGANFAYKKNLFNELNGFSGNTQIASGDDIFLLEKIAHAYPKKLFYLKDKNAIVKTASQVSWHKLVSQRIRWASKTSAYHNWFGKITGGIVFLMNSLLVLVVPLFLLGYFNPKAFLSLLIIKFSLDLLLIYKSAQFFEQQSIIKTYPLGFIIYPIFSVYIALKSLCSDYKWKDRTFRNSSN